MRMLIIAFVLLAAARAFDPEDPESLPDEGTAVPPAVPPAVPQTIQAASAPTNVAPGQAATPIKNPFTFEVIDGKKFKVFQNEERIPHGFSKKVFIKKTRDHIIKYIRLKKCGCKVSSARRTWEGKHQKLWYDEKPHNSGHGGQQGAPNGEHRRSVHVRDAHRSKKHNH